VLVGEIELNTKQGEEEGNIYRAGNLIGRRVRGEFLGHKKGESSEHGGEMIPKKKRAKGGDGQAGAQINLHKRRSGENKHL